MRLRENGWKRWGGGFFFVETIVGEVQNVNYIVFQCNCMVMFDPHWF